MPGGVGTDRASSGVCAGPIDSRGGTRFACRPRATHPSTKAKRKEVNEAMEKIEIRPLDRLETTAQSCPRCA